MIEINFDCDLNTKKQEIKESLKNSIDLILDIVEFKKKNFYISIFLTNNDNIKKINLRFRKIDKVTNVLSFRQNEERIVRDSEKYLILGDIVISLEKILSEAKEQNKNFADHLIHMLVHGLLHLLGYDHENEKDAEIMEKKEILILSKLSISNPY
jgi:probable rRNA maturation factor